MSHTLSEAVSEALLVEMPKTKEPGLASETGPPRTSLNSAASTPLASAVLDGSATIAVFDWRFAARVSERAQDLHLIDFALTATSLAAEIRDWLARS